MNRLNTWSAAVATVLALFALFPLSGRGEDWPAFGRDSSRNAVSPEKGAPKVWQLTEREPRSVLWEANLGSRSCASPVVANGLVWVGTNNVRPRDPKVKEDASVLMCFRGKDGKFLWQYVSPRLEDQYQDFPNTGLNCSPLVEGDRLYFTTNRCEVVCLDVGPLQQGKGEPRQLWKLDMHKDQRVYPAGPPCPGIGLTCSIGASYRGRLYVTTGNGVGEDGQTLPAPEAPSLLCLDRDSGKVLWSDSSPGKGILQTQWSSPLVAEVAGRTQVMVAQGDGWLRSFDPQSGALIWKFDTNPKAAQWKGRARGTRNYLPATPVLHGGLVYIANGQGPEDGAGVGHLWCIDPGRTPKNESKDLSPVGDNFDPKARVNQDSGLVWHFGGPLPPEEKDKGRSWAFGRTMSTVAVHDGLVIAPEIDGYVHCLDALTGREYWVYDANAVIHASPLLVDGKVYVPCDDKVAVLALSREKTLLAENDVDESCHCGVVFANGVLYLATDAKLYALRSGEK